MHINKKSGICILLMILIIWIAVGIGILYLREQSVKLELEKRAEWVNSGERAYGNYIFYKKDNGLHTFPFLWGQGIYMYSIKEDKSFPIVIIKSPISGLEAEITVAAEYIYYETLYEASGGNGYRKNILNSQIEDVKELRGASHFTVCGNKIYYLEPDWEEANGKVYYKNLTEKQAKRELLLTGGFTYIGGDETILYCYDQLKPGITELDLASGEKKAEYSIDKKEGHVQWIGANEKGSRFILYEDGTIMEIGKDTKGIKYLQSDPSVWIHYGCKFKNGYLYYWDSSGMTLYRLDLNSGEKRRLIADRQIDKIKDLDRKNTKINVSYCSDYIVIDVSYRTKKQKFGANKKILLLFDYEGNLKKYKKLN